MSEKKKSTYEKVKLFGKNIKINTLLFCGLVGAPTGIIYNVEAYMNRSEEVKQYDERMRKFDPEHCNENATNVLLFSSVMAMCAAGLGCKRDEEDTRSFMQRLMENSRDGLKL